MAMDKNIEKSSRTQGLVRPESEMNQSNMGSSENMKSDTSAPDRQVSGSATFSDTVTTYGNVSNSGSQYASARPRRTPQRVHFRSSRELLGPLGQASPAAHVSEADTKTPKSSRLSPRSIALQQEKTSAFKYSPPNYSGSSLNSLSSAKNDQPGNLKKRQPQRISRNRISGADEEVPYSSGIPFFIEEEEEDMDSNRSVEMSGTADNESSANPFLRQNTEADKYDNRPQISKSDPNGLILDGHMTESEPNLNDFLFEMVKPVENGEKLELEDGQEFTSDKNEIESNLNEKSSFRRDCSYDNFRKLALKLVRAHSKRAAKTAAVEPIRPISSETDLGSYSSSPQLESDYERGPSDFSRHYRGGILSQLLKLYSNPHSFYSNQQTWQGDKEWRTSAKQLYSRRAASSNQLNLLRKNFSSSRVNSMINLAPSLNTYSKSSSASLHSSISNEDLPQNHKFPYFRKRFKPDGNRNSKLEEELKISVRVADILQRQNFLKKLCHTFMLYGSPTHRLEEQMQMTAKALEINGQFLYIPGAMIISFGDPSTHTSDMHVIRVVNVVLDLGKLQQVCDIGKFVIHNVMEVEEANRALDNIIKRPVYFKTWVLIFFYGLASASVGLMAFNGRWIDAPMAFILGVIVGFLQLIVGPRQSKYINALEILEVIITSFLARAIGSIPGKNGSEVFCYPSLALSAIVLILPGYIVLCGSLELQSKSIVAGSVRMFYAIIYSLFLSFGMLLGSVIFGFMSDNANKTSMCAATISPFWRFLLVPVFTLCLMVVNQARPRQFPIMFVVAAIGYLVNYFSNVYLGSSQIANAFAAFSMGLIGNLYSRIGPYFRITESTSLSFAAMLPGVLLLVPSALAAQGGFKQGINNAIAIVDHYKNKSKLQQAGGSDILGTESISFGLNMVQIAIGMTVGLYVAALVVYPMGKKRSGLFAF